MPNVIQQDTTFWDVVPSTSKLVYQPFTVCLKNNFLMWQLFHHLKAASSANASPSWTSIIESSQPVWGWIKESLSSLKQQPNPIFLLSWKNETSILQLTTPKVGLLHKELDVMVEAWTWNPSTCFTHIA